MNDVDAVLQDELKLYEQIVNASSDALVFIDRDFRYQAVNGAYLRMWNRRREELIGRPVRENVGDWIFDELIKPRLEKCLSGGQARFVDRVDLPHKADRYIEATFDPYRNPRGDITGTVVNVRDVTERANAEQSLRDRQRELHSLINAAPAGIGTLRERVFLTVNTLFCRMLGYREEELIGRDARMIYFTDEEYERVGREKYALLRQSGLGEMESRFRRKDGSAVDVLVRSAWLDDQRPEAGATFTVLDITGRKQAEEHLRDSEYKYRTLFERIPQGVVVQDASGRILDCNPSAQRILGRSREEMLGLGSQSPDWRCIHEDGSDFLGDTHPVMEALRNGVATKKVVMGVFNRDRNDYVWLSVDAVPLYHDGADLPYGVFSSFTDITQDRLLQQALIHSQKLEAVGRLAGGIAHDFNNILGSVLGFAELAKLRNGPLDEKMAGYLEQIETAGLRARDLVRQLLIYSRGERTGDLTAIAVAPMIKETMKLLRPMLPAGIDIRVDLANDLPPVRMAALHLQQMLMNLCINARDAMPDGGVLSVSVNRTELHGEPCVICNHALAGDYVQLCVADTGCGILPEHRELLFQPFFTTKEVGEGAGMGLAVVQGLVRTYRGHALLSSDPGSGAEFRLLFRPADTAPAEQESILAVDGPGHRIKGCRVLVAEDEFPIREYYREIMTQAGGEVVCCCEGREALEAFVSGTGVFDALLIDLGMPGMGGIELLKGIRALNTKVPAIVCSGNHDALDADTIRRLGICQVLLKPVQSAELIGTIQAVVKERR
jgi:two-component system cell cycle sensor histidine kinase/response regulator CckA